MPVMTYGQSSFGISVPVGRYVAKFLGTESRKPIEGSDYGNDGQPRMAFIFEVAEGDQKGQRIIQETNTVPSAGSGCGRMLIGLAGRELTAKEQIDTDNYINKMYSVKVGVNPKSPKGNLHIADLEPHTGFVPTRPSAPPPRPNGAAPAAATTLDKYYVDSAKCEFDMSYDSNYVRELIFAEGLKAKDLALCKEGDKEWKTAAAYGFEDAPIQ